MLLVLRAENESFGENEQKFVYLSPKSRGLKKRREVVYFLKLSNGKWI